MEKTCCVTGHRNIPADKMDYIWRKLEREVKQALEDGHRTFLTGFAEGADMMFARCVDKQRCHYQNVFLEAALPYAGRTAQLDQQATVLLARCDGIKIICHKYQPDCFLQRNRYMVQNSSWVVAVYDGRTTGGTLYTMNYARAMERDLRIIRI